MKIVKRIVLVVAFLAIVASLAITFFDLNVNLVLHMVMGLGGAAIILGNSAFDFARTPGLSKKNFLRKFIVWIYHLAWGFLVGYSVIDIIFKLRRGYEGSFMPPIVMLGVGVAMFVAFVIVVTAKDSDKRKLDKD